MIKHSTKFNLLTQPNANGFHSVRMRVSWAGNRYECVLPISIDPKHWDETNHKVRKSFHPNGDTKICSKYNEIITGYKSQTDKFFLMCEVNQVDATKDELRKYLDKTKDVGPSSPRMRMMSELSKEYLEECLALNMWTRNTYAHARARFGLAESYRPYARIGEINSEYLKGLMDYLFDYGDCNSTVADTIQRIKAFLIWCQDRGYPIDSSALKFKPRFKGTSVCANEINYLTWEELMLIVHYPLEDNPLLCRVRDVFVFCCFCGLRYSDAIALKKSDISDGRIRVVTEKTIVAINIELNKTTKAILDKYKDFYSDDKALPRCACSDFNKRMKMIAKMAGINSLARLVRYVRSERIEQLYPKCEIISSHWARHTFIVNALRLGIPGEVIMSWTGHMNFESMKPYLKIMNNYRSEMMKRFDMSTDKITIPSPFPYDVGESIPYKKELNLEGGMWRTRLTEDKTINMSTKMELLMIMREVSSSDCVPLGELSKRLKVHVNTIRHRMEFLVENGYLTCSGYGRSTRWHIVEE